jgi:hypothetical protein
MGGFAGFLPGVAEEIAVALEEGVPVYVLGGFGGAAEQVAAVMSGSRAEGLTIDSFMRNPKYRSLNQAAKGQDRANELSSRVEWLWGQLGRSDLQNGLTKEENTVLWGTLDVGLAVALISKGLRIDRR